MALDKVQVKLGYKRPQPTTVLPIEYLMVGLSLAADSQPIYSGGYEGKGLHELGFESCHLGHQSIVVSDSGVVLEQEVFILSYQCGKLVS
jgi:hypothetical protein